MKEITVGIGEYKVESNAILKTIGLGSCIGLAIYSPVKKVGGLAHVMLPSGSNNGNAKYANAAVRLLVEELEKMGAFRFKLIAKIAGGAQIFKQMNMNILKIGDRNIESVRENLSKFGIKIISEDIGGHLGRSVYFDTTTGAMRVRYSNGEELWI
jgi:chemotaxis protein CheD